MQDYIVSADISRDMYLKSKNFVMQVAQEGKPLIEADTNNQSEIFVEWLRDLIANMTEEVFHHDAFKLVEGTTSNENNFKITSGWVYPGGWQGCLSESVHIINDGTLIAEHLICGFSSELTNDVLTDAAMNWHVGELVGRKLIPNINVPDEQFEILSNTANSISCSTSPTHGLSDVGVVGDSYAIVPSTPNTDNPIGVDRYDTVWLNAYPVEITGAMDADLLHPIGGGLECDRRIQVRLVVHVLEKSDVYGDYPDTYIDSRGTKHFLLKIATLEREYNNSLITSAMIKDARALSVINRLVRWLGSTDNLHETSMPYTSTKYIKATMSIVAALSRLDQVIYGTGSVGELGILAGKVGEDLITVIDPESGPPNYGGPDYAIQDGQTHNEAIGNLDLEADRVRNFLGKEEISTILPNYEAQTAGFYIALNDNLQTAIGKLDSALKDEELERIIQDGLIRADLASTTPAGARLVGIDNSAIPGINTATNVQDGLAELGTNLSKNIKWQYSVVSLYNQAPPLNYIPADPNNVAMWVGDTPQNIGIAYTVNALGVVTWDAGNAGFTLQVGWGIFYLFVG